MAAPLRHAAMHSAASYVNTPWSFDTLPTAGEWAGGQATYWEERVRRTSTEQLLVLHRECMHCNAILLPAAEMQGPDSPAHMKVRGRLRAGALQRDSAACGGDGGHGEPSAHEGERGEGKGSATPYFCKRQRSGDRTARRTWRLGNFTPP